MQSRIAITREVSPTIVRCELTHAARVPIDVGLARRQHAAYEAALSDLGCDVHRLPAGGDLPDSVFVEDIAVVLDGWAVITRPGAESRRNEIPAVENALKPHRRIARVGPPGTLDGGDVLLIGRRLLVGASGRTNAAGIQQLRELSAPLGYTVEPIVVSGCLHLKSAMTAVDDRTVLVNRAWIPPEALEGFDVIEVDEEEPYAANVVRVGEMLVYPEAFPRTLERLQRRGFNVRTVDVSELAKAEGAVTCCSVIFEA